jgi:hypothetical protein
MRLFSIDEFERDRDDYDDDVIRERRKAFALADASHVNERHRRLVRQRERDEHRWEDRTDEETL